ncbi:nitrilase-related carbon-nitrogen hydrolase [Methanoregula sp. UBA64]|jgi:omega-amidase|uniref:nitrilase-related carbon-nitrogen hydrolase n=1 Tax=Methanoregula sp. UBA64 TaxID=1915554 RepID=UPI0025CFEE1E|nr:nitrilase-related carbon-nitrogen hydrolase [Methanoregula sp. UBA64]
MRCCSVQTAGVWESPEKNLIQAEQRISEAARAGAGLVAFPEQHLTGWDPKSSQNCEEITGPAVTGLRRLAKNYSIAIIGSFREAAVPKPKNTVVAIGSEGELLAQYSKIHLFTPGHEDRAFSPGTGLATFSVRGARFGLAICYDLRFPELFRLYRSEGVHAVIVPAAWPENRIRYWELFIQSRAAENQMYVVGVNTTGTTPVDRYSGSSMTADPHGTIIARAGPGEELLFYDIDPAFAETVRQEFPVNDDRKDALYVSLMRGQHGPDSR